MSYRYNTDVAHCCVTNQAIVVKHILTKMDYTILHTHIRMEPLLRLIAVSSRLQPTSQPGVGVREFIGIVGYKKLEGEGQEVAIFQQTAANL